MVTFRRLATKEQLDYYPTSPWATRAFFKYVVYNYNFGNMTCLEPACGEGHMSKVLKQHFKKVVSSDIADHGYGEQRDFLSDKFDEFDWVITNAPYNLALEFTLTALKIAKLGVAMFTRIQFLEGLLRYNTLIKDNPPAIVAPFVERVHLQKDKIVKNSGSTTLYCWMVWNQRKYSVWDNTTRLTWIPPCRKKLEKETDYEMVVC